MRVSTLVVVIALIAGLGYYLSKTGTLDKMRKDADNSFGVHYAKGQGSFNASKYEEAIKEFEKALALSAADSDAPVASMRIGDCYKELKQNEKAIDAYQKCIKDYPNFRQRGQIEQTIEKIKGLK